MCVYVSVVLLSVVFAGKGLPFFGTTFPGVVKTDENKKMTGEIAKKVRIGLLFERLIWFMPCSWNASTHATHL